MVVLSHTVFDIDKCDGAVLSALHYPALLHAVLCHIIPYPGNSLLCMLVCPFWVLGSSQKSCGVCDLTLR